MSSLRHDQRRDRRDPLDEWNWIAFFVGFVLSGVVLFFRVPDLAWSFLDRPAVYMTVIVGLATLCGVLFGMWGGHVWKLIDAIMWWS